MKTEAEVFFTETKPFIEHLAERVNPQFPLNMSWAYPYLEPLMNERPFDMETADPGTKGPAISIGSGPSLDVCMPYLNQIREKHDAPIFCTASQVWSLYYQGVTPDYVTQHDPWARGCPICGELDKTHVYFDDAGECYCFKGHHLTGEQRETAIRGTNVHRWAPEIGCKVLFHPGVQLEQMHWPDLAKRGEMYFNNFNPNIGQYPARDIVRGQVFGKSGEEFRVGMNQAVADIINKVANNMVNMKNMDKIKGMIQELLQDFRLDTEWEKMITTMLNAPGAHEPQDTPMWIAAMLYGEGNPRLKHPVRTAAPFAPSTTFQNAVLAYMKGYNPIYFVGYDLCHWKHMGYHHKFWYDKTEIIPVPHDPPGKDTRVGLNGFQTDYVQIGEKYALAGYFSKEFNGHYGLPGLQLVEVIADGTPGNLEFYPKVDVDRFAEGETKNVAQDVTAKKIQAIIRERKMQENWDIKQTPKMAHPEAKE